MIFEDRRFCYCQSRRSKIFHPWTWRSGDDSTWQCHNEGKVRIKLHVLFCPIISRGAFELCSTEEEYIMCCKGNSICLINILSPIYSISVQIPVYCREQPVKQCENSSKSFDLRRGGKKTTHCRLNVTKVFLKFILKNHEILLMWSWKPIICVCTVLTNVCPNQTFSQGLGKMLVRI